MSSSGRTFLFRHYRPGLYTLEWYAVDWHKAETPTPEGGNPDTLPRVDEERRYRIHLWAEDGEPVELFHVQESLTKHLHRSRNGTEQGGEVHFRSLAGECRFQIRRGERVLDECGVEVVPSKMDYRRDYVRMVEDLQNLLPALVLQPWETTLHRGRPSAPRCRSGLEWLHLFQAFRQSMEDAVRHIARNPLHDLRRHPETVRCHRVRRADGLVRRQVCQGRGSGGWESAPGGIAWRERLAENRPLPDEDIPEHRWLRWALGDLRKTARHLGRSLEDEPERSWGRDRSEASPRRLRDHFGPVLDALGTDLDRWLRTHPFDAEDRIPPPEGVSLRLQGRPGYRELFLGIMALKRCLRGIEGTLALHLKDTHRLYEYWVFLTLLRQVADLAEEVEPLAAKDWCLFDPFSLQTALRQGHAGPGHVFRIQGKRVTLEYNRSFGAPLLVAQKPDMLLSVETGGFLDWYVLDAKYRVETCETYLDRFGAPGPPEDALNTLHRYRDALGVWGAQRGTPCRVRQALAIFPGSESEAGAFEKALWWRSIGSLGVGALPLLPDCRDYLARWVRGVVGIPA